MVLWLQGTQLCLPSRLLCCSPRPCPPPAPSSCADVSAAQLDPLWSATTATTAGSLPRTPVSMSVPAAAFAAPSAVSSALTGRPRALRQQRSRAATSHSALRASTFVVAPSRRQPWPTAAAAAHRPRWTAVVDDVGPTAEVIIGSIALCVPFVVASVLFGERIVRWSVSVVGSLGAFFCLAGHCRADEGHVFCHSSCSAEFAPMAVAAVCCVTAVPQAFPLLAICLPGRRLTLVPVWTLTWLTLHSVSSIDCCLSFPLYTLQVRQRRCPTCEGSGLVQKGRFMRRCRTCGGFLPWQSWRQFFGLPPKKV